MPLDHHIVHYLIEQKKQVCSVNNLELVSIEPESSAKRYSISRFEHRACNHTKRFDPPQTYLELF